MIAAPLKILIIEDELLIGAKIATLLDELGYSTLAVATEAKEALWHVDQQRPDLAIVDIRLKGDVDGIALAQVLLETHAIPVVFLTANSDDATFQRAKKSKPFAFLSKPLQRMDLERTLELLASRLDLQSDSSLDVEPPEMFETPVLNDRIFVREKEKMVKVLYTDILYIEAERNYCNLVTMHKTYLLTMPMKNLETQMPQNRFQRIHRSYIINLEHVEALDEFSVTIAHKVLPMSKTYRAHLIGRVRIA